MAMTMTIRDENELKKWQNEKKAVCKAKNFFTNVDVKENIAEVVMEIERVVGKDTNYSSKETTIVVKHKNVKMMDFKVNTRIPTVTQQVHDMWNQIIDCSAAFKENNLGITVYCKSATIYEENGKKYIKIIFGEHGGVENGGHTLAAILEGNIMDILSDEGEVKIFVREYTKDITSEDVATTCKALNSMRRQKLYGFGEISGYHENFKKAIGSPFVEKIEWKPDNFKGESEDLFFFDAIDIIGMAYVMAPNGNGGFTNKFDTANNKNNCYKAYISKKEKGEKHSCEKMLPLMPDVLKVAEHIMINFHKVPKNCVSKFEFVDSDKLSPLTNVPMEKTLPRLLLFPILAALSENIIYDRKTGAISTYMDFCELYDLSANAIWKALNDLQGKYGKAGKYVFSTSTVAAATWNLMRSEVRNVINSVSTKVA